MSVVRERVSASVPTILLILCTGCSGDSSITGPLSNIDGRWLILRTLESDSGCVLPSDTTPIELTFRVRDGLLEIRNVSVPDSLAGLTGSIESDGDFEVLDVLGTPGVFTETIRIEGRVTREVLTAIESHEFVYEDPELIEIIGEQCEIRIRWEGERV